MGRKTSSRRQSSSDGGVRRNNFAFGIALILTQVAVCLVFGFFARVSPYERKDEYAGSLFPCVYVFLLFFLILAFAMMLAFLKRLVWSSVAFTFLITSLTIQFYFLFNALWFKAGISGEGAFAQKQFYVHLAKIGRTDTHGSTLTQALQCSLANTIAFSSVLGKVGVLDAWVVALVGTMGYELNRQILLRFSWVDGGTFSIFTFGSFMGLFMGLVLLCKYKRRSNQTKNIELYTGSPHSVAISLLGTLLAICLLPVAILDQEDQFGGELHSMYPSAFMSMMTASFACLTMNIGVSITINHKASVRDIVEGSIAGSISIASTAFYISKPLDSIVIGSIVGLLQPLLQNFIQKHFSTDHQIVNTFSFFAFGFHGILGGVFKTVLKAIEFGRNSQQVNADNFGPPIFGFVESAISAGTGIFFGSVAGVFLLGCAVHKRKDHYNDFCYWHLDDGIRYKLPKYEEELEETKTEKNFYVVELNRSIHRHTYV